MTLKVSGFERESVDACSLQSKMLCPFLAIEGSLAPSYALSLLDRC